MTRFAISLALTVGALTLASAQAPDLTKDERLAKPVTVRVKMVPLPEAMAALTKASGVPLEATTSLKDLKVTILVKDQPAHLVLSKVASTLDLEWEADGTSYRIKSNSDVANAERRYVEQEDRLHRQAAENELKKLAAVAAVPYPQAKERDAQLVPERYLLGQLFRGLNAAGWNAFWSGKTVRTAAPLQGEAAAQALDQGDRRRREGDRRDRPGRSFRIVRVAAQYDPLSHRLRTSFEQQRATGGLGRLIQEPYPQGELATTTFGKRVLAWEVRNDEAEALTKSFSPVAAKSDGWFAGWTSSADALESLHLGSGAPIVADAFRVSVRPVASAGTPVAWLNAFRQANSALVRTEDGFALVRHGGYWRLRRLEVPERAARALEAKKTPSLEDYATYAAALTPLQGLVYQVPGAALLRVSPDPLRTALPALRFYASLGALQRQARQNQPVPFGVLGAAQRDLFLDALDGAFDGGATVGRGSLIDVQAEANALAFLLTLQEVPNPAEANALRLGTRLLFGTTARDGTVYVLNAPPRS